MAPSSGAGAGAPRPRNDSAARVSDRLPTSRLAVTRVAGIAPGSRWRTARADPPAPASRAASRWGRAARASDLAAHDTGVEGPPDDRHRDQGVGETRAEGGDHRDGQDRSGQGEEHVGEPHEHVVDPARRPPRRPGRWRRRSARPTRSPRRPRTSWSRSPNSTRVKMSLPDVVGAEQEPVVEWRQKGRPAGWVGL